MGSDISRNEVARFDITACGQTFTHEEPNGFQRMIIEDHVDMIGMAQITVGKEVEWGSFELGGDVEVKVGGNDRKIFVGYVTGLRHQWSNGDVSLTIVAMDPLVKLSASRRTIVFEESTDSDAASATISAAGESSGTVDSTSATHKYIFQRNESDLNFIKRLAARNGYLVMANEGKIDFAKPQFGGPITVKAEEGKIVALDYTFSDVNVPTAVKVIGWDYVTKEKVEYESSTVDTIGSGTDAVGSAKTWQDKSYISDVWVSVQGAAEAMANGEMNRLARSLIRGRIKMEGDGQFFAGAIVQTEGLRDGYDVTGYVVSARHMVEFGGGFTTEIVFVGNTAPE